MRGRGERSRIEELEDQVTILRVMGRRLWDMLRARNAAAAIEVYNTAGEDGRRLIDRVYDASAVVWERQRIMVVPCRIALDPKGSNSLTVGWPVQSEMYLGKWPDDSTRNLTRDQVLMMAGMDPDQPDEAEVEPEVPV